MSKQRRPKKKGTASRIGAPPSREPEACEPGFAGSKVSSSLAVWFAIALVILNVLVFSAVRHHEFINIDDAAYIKDNPHVTGGLTWANVSWAWTTGTNANWHPLTWMSHMLDVQLFGVDAGPQHVVNLIFHVATTLILFLLLCRLTGALGRSAFVAALFAAHPLHVESVAWVAERKDVLSALFWVLTFWGYAAYVRRPDWRRYLLVVLLFALGLTAKPMLVTLPFTLLLLDVWPLRRIKGFQGPGWWRLVVEKLPLFLMSAASGVVTFIVQQRSGAVAQLDAFSPSLRVENALVSYVAYLGKMIWPARLAIFYSHAKSIPFWATAGAIMVLAILSIGAGLAARRHPYIAFGWLWYLGTLLPVIGLIQVGTQAMADRYTYMPLLGIFIIIAWGVPDLVSRWPARRVLLPAAAAAVVLLCALTARAQTGYWRTNYDLWRHTLDVTRDNYVAEDVFGSLLVELKRPDEALAHFEASVRINPEYPDSRNNLGLQYMNRGKFEAAIEQFTLALQRRPDFADAHNNLGFALMSTKKTDDAILQYREALRLNPDFADAHNNLGFALAVAQRVPEAIPHFREAVRLRPDSEVVHMYLGLALAGTGKYDEAAVQFREVLRINPQSSGAQNALERLPRENIRK
jgi:protein O-mannosyl-transferase